MGLRSSESLGWPASRLGDALAALARETGLAIASSELTNPRSLRPEHTQNWIEWAAQHIGCEAESIASTLQELENDLAAAHPALLRISDSCFLAVVNGDRKSLRILTPELRIRTVSTRAISQKIRDSHTSTARSEIETLLNESGLSPSRRSIAIDLLVSEHLGGNQFNQCWVLRSPPGTSTGRWLRESGAIQNGGALVTAHATQYLLWLASWAILGSLSLRGRMDRGWLTAWALLLLTMVPFRLFTTWVQGLLAIGVGGSLKRRLLRGAMRLGPEEMRHCGIGSFLGQTLEAEALETLALSGAIAGVLAIIELAVSAVVLGRMAVLLLFWCGATTLLAWRFLRRYQRWTEIRMDMTQDVVESMVGHRTRLAQQPREEWHESEDRALDGYLQHSRALDGSGTWLIGAIPRAWLLTSLACLAPAIISGQDSGATIGIALGGILLAFTAFKRLSGSFADVTAAWVSWERIAPLFQAASRPQQLSQVPFQSSPEKSPKVIDAERLTYRYRKEGNPALHACSLVVRSGERILLEGQSGGGKTTFASVLTGMRQPESGLLVIGGLDRHSIGIDQWRERVVAAPQFHENHILTETLAFNLLMGRGWPPAQADTQEAESICRELGLGDLLDRMPSGLQQMVGEGGWQLSHGERSRIYIARALLQKAELIILDESFAALDPENLRTALECTLRRAETLMVIAHP